MPKHRLAFLADESLEYRLVLFLRNSGYDVLSVSENSPSIADEAILAKADIEGRVLLTNDKDFGELIFFNQLPHKGVILFRLKSEDIKEKIKITQTLLRDYKDELAGNFVVVTENNIRIR